MKLHFSCRVGEILQEGQPFSTAVYQAGGDVRQEFQETLVRRRKKPKIQSQILKLAKISGVISVITHIGIMLLQRTKLFVARDDFPILQNHRDGQIQTKQALMYFKRRPLMMTGTCMAKSHCLNLGSV